MNFWRHEGRHWRSPLWLRILAWVLEATVHFTNRHVRFTGRKSNKRPILTFYNVGGSRIIDGRPNAEMHSEIAIRRKCDTSEVGFSSWEVGGGRAESGLVVLCVCVAWCVPAAVCLLLNYLTWMPCQETIVMAFSLKLRQFVLLVVLLFIVITKWVHSTARVYYLSFKRLYLPIFKPAQDNTNIASGSCGISDCVRQVDVFEEVHFLFSLGTGYGSKSQILYAFSKCAKS